MLRAKQRFLRHKLVLDKTAYRPTGLQNKIVYAGNCEKNSILGLGCSPTSMQQFFDVFAANSKWPCFLSSGRQEIALTELIMGLRERHCGFFFKTEQIMLTSRRGHPT